MNDRHHAITNNQSRIIGGLNNLILDLVVAIAVADPARARGTLGRLRSLHVRNIEGAYDEVVFERIQQSLDMLERIDKGELRISAVVEADMQAQKARREIMDARREKERIARAQPVAVSGKRNVDGTLHAGSIRLHRHPVRKEP